MNNQLQKHIQSTRSITFSVFDRLLDNEPERLTERPVSLSHQIEQEREFIRRDIETLLNTRPAQGELPVQLTELANSVLSYGVGSFVSLGLGNNEAQLTLANKLEPIIAHIEPRLSDIHITLYKDYNSSQRALKMRIEGRFRIQEQSQAVFFDTSLDYSSQQFTVEVSDE